MLTWGTGRRRERYGGREGGEGKAKRWEEGRGRGVGEEMGKGKGEGRGGNVLGARMERMWSYLILQSRLCVPSILEPNTNITNLHACVHSA